MMIPVEGHKNLFRNSETGAIINCDDIGYNNYLKARQDKMKQRDEINHLKEEISEIKNLLKELINGSKSNST